MNGNLKKEFGDYQTPYEFTTKIVSIVNDFISFTPTIVIEPTCGVGNFLLSARNFFKNSYLLGIDINKEYLFQAKKKLKGIVDDNFYTLKEENIFDYDYKKVKNLDNILILGNPPWVTNSYLEFNEASNLPIKTNFKKLNGFEAISGTSNFDISEYIILDIFKKLQNKNFSLAMLCKISVAINIMKELKKKNIGVYSCFLAKFDTKEIFNVSVDACLFFVEIKKYSDYCVDRIKLYNLENNSLIYKTDMGFINNIFFTDIFNYNIEFDRVFFRYPNSDEYIIKNFSFTFEFGKNYSILGRNGSGKSTLIKLLLGLYRVEKGNIRIGGVDINDISLEQKSKIFSVLFQHPKKYPFTIFENINLEESQKGDLDIDKSIVEFVENFNDGIDSYTSINYKNNVNLSGGQWKNIFFNRVFLRKSKVFIFDEPTSNLDPFLELEYYKNIQDKISGSLNIFISHRLGIVKYTDIILLIEDGNLIESGTHDELISYGGKYFEMYEIQKSIFD